MGNEPVWTADDQQERPQTNCAIDRLVRFGAAEQYGPDLFRLIGSEEKITAGSLFDTVHAETGLHDSARRVRVVREHQVAGLVGNHVAKDQSLCSLFVD